MDRVALKSLKEDVDARGQLGVFGANEGSRLIAALLADDPKPTPTRAANKEALDALVARLRRPKRRRSRS